MSGHAPRTITLRIGVASALLVVTAIAGCATSQSSPEATPRDTSEWPFAVFPADPLGEGRAAELLGVLVLEEGCLMVRVDVGDPTYDGTMYSLRLPDTVTWTDGALITGDDTGYRPGDRIAFYGATVSREVALRDGLPDTCPSPVWSVS